MLCFGTDERRGGYCSVKIRDNEDDDDGAV